MKIRGGDLDLVEYEFQPFFPGENIHTLGFEREYNLSPFSGKVKAVAPGRIHLTVLDMNRFAPNRPGGGGRRIRPADVLFCRGGMYSFRAVHRLLP